MENLEIAQCFEELADLLEIEGENAFKIRAYRAAAQTILDRPAPLRLLAELPDAAAQLQQLPGIGKEIAKKIEVLVRQGELPQLTEARTRVPRGLLELMRLPGVGPKKAARLWRELGVTTVAELQTAAEEGRVAQLSGFGAKSQQKILDGIGEYLRRDRRTPLADADRLVALLLEYLQAPSPDDASTEAAPVRRVVAAGSYRRRRETVGDLDLLVVASPAEPVIRRFVAHPRVEQVLAAGSTKAAVVLHDGIQVDLRVVAEDSFGAALSYFTGSKAHNVHLRRRALERGCSLSEYALVRLPGGSSADQPVEQAPVQAATITPASPDWVAGRTEEEIYAALGLDWVPPELREDRGEVEAAARHALPRLITVADLRGDLQMHSTWSDGRHTIAQMAQACLDRGYEYLAITDHSRALAMVHGLDARRVREQAREVAEARAQVPGIRLLHSLEVDILADGALDLEDDVLGALDLVVASVHSRFDLPPAEQTARILRALHHPAVSILAHPTGRLIQRRPPMNFDLDAVLRAAAELGVAVELNAHPARLDLHDVHLRRAKELGVMLVIDTDAHRAEELDLMRYGVDQARRAGLEPSDVINTLPFAEFRARLGPRCRAS